MVMAETNKGFIIAYIVGLTEWVEKHLDCAACACTDVYQFLGATENSK